MKKLSCYYEVVNTTGVLLTNGNFNYSLSHYMFALFQSQNFNLPTNKIYSNFQNILNSTWMGSLCLVFANQAPVSILTDKMRIATMQLLHSFGYFALKDMGYQSLSFVNRNQKSSFINKNHTNRTYLFGVKNSQTVAMTFHFTIPNQKLKQICSNMFMTKYIPSKGNTLIHNQSKFKIKIVDPVEEGLVRSKEIENMHFEQTERIRKWIGMSGREFVRIFDNIKIRIILSCIPIEKTGERVDIYESDGIFVYTFFENNNQTKNVQATK